MKKKTSILSVILSMFILFAALASTAAAEETVPFEGQGNENAPYLIKTSDELYLLAEIVNSGYSFDGEYIKLDADIALNDISNADDWAEHAPENTWTPIGNDYTVAFGGIFDGGNHTISGLYIHADCGLQGLFGVSTGTIKNIILADSFICGAGHYVAGIAAVSNTGESKQYHDSVIENCTNNAVIFNTDLHTGGITASGNIVRNCVNNGSVTSTTDCIAGIATYACIVKDCVNNGDVTGVNNIAGICTSNYCEQEHGFSLQTLNCTNNGKVTGVSNVYPTANSSPVSSVIDCINNGSVEMSAYPGILRGDMNLDKKITAADARIVLRMSAKLESYTQEEVDRGDVTLDKKLTAADARIILRYSAGLEDYYRDFGIDLKAFS